MSSGEGGVPSAGAASSGAPALGGTAGTGSSFGGATAEGGGPTAGQAGTPGAGGASGASNGGAGTGTGGASGTKQPWTPSFETKVLSNQHFSEGAAVADIDGDGTLDLVTGPNWYAGPQYALGGKVADAKAVPPEDYSEFFLVFVDDLNADQRPDVIAIADAGDNPNARWYENPGTAGFGKAWPMHPLYDTVSNESPLYTNLLGDAKKELVFMTGQRLGYGASGASPTAKWTFAPLSPTGFSTPYVHGLGVGDIDGDGLNDIVERSGFWRQVTGEAQWQKTAVDFAAGVPKTGTYGGGQMLVFDVDGDADADVVSSLNAHGYGLSWFEQSKSGSTITFAPHPILPTSNSEGNISQLHALEQADLNGDGLTDFVTGKRYYAHTYDPGAEDPAILAWFELQRSGGEATFVRHAIHEDSGVGCVFAIHDVNGDGKPDIFTSSKKGAFLHLQR